MNNRNMHESAYQKLKEQSWLRPLGPDETAEMQRYLAAHPGAQHDWDDEAGLSACLNRLPAAPVSSNFTARVMQAVERGKAQPTWRNRFSPRHWWRAGWMPRLAMSTAMLCLGLVSFHQYQFASRAKLAVDVEQFAKSAPMPEMDWLKDFDTIQRMSEVQVADDELLSVNN